MLDGSPSLVNKTALSAATNRKIGGRSPAEYVKTVEAAAGIVGEELDGVFHTHLLDPAALRAADFEAFFADRRARLLELIGQAMGKPVVNTETESPAVFVDEPDEPSDIDAEATPVPEEPALIRPTAQESPPAPTVITAQFPGNSTTASPSAGDEAQGSVVSPAAAENLERRFHAAMVEVYRRAKQETGYHAGYFLQMLSERGGFATARHLLQASTVLDGFTTLWERHRLDLTVEAVVLRQEFAPLFTLQELEGIRWAWAAGGRGPGSARGEPRRAGSARSTGGRCEDRVHSNSRRCYVDTPVVDTDGSIASARSTAPVLELLVT